MINLNTSGVPISTSVNNNCSLIRHTRTMLFTSLSTGTSQVLQKNFYLITNSQFITSWQKLFYYLTEIGGQITKQIICLSVRNKKTQKTPCYLICKTESKMQHLDVTEETDSYSLQVEKTSWFRCFTSINTNSVRLKNLQQLRSPDNSPDCNVILTRGMKTSCTIPANSLVESAVSKGSHTRIPSG